MATITKKNVDTQFLHTAPYGNVWANQYHFETNSAGVWVDSDKTTAIASGDNCLLGILPGGLKILDALIIRSNVFKASATASIGFQYCDGVNASAPAAQDPVYFCTTLALSSLGVTRKTETKVPLTLPKDAYLTLLHADQTQDEVGIIDIIVYGIWTGSSLT